MALSTPEKQMPQTKAKTPEAKKPTLNVVKGTPMTTTPLTKEDLLPHYTSMLRIRRFEERAANMYQQGYMGGFCHLYIGQEAVVVGVKAAAKEADDFITSYRCHAHALACGVPPIAVMAELTGRAIGISKGKGGSMHMFDPAKRFWGGHGIVAAQIPLGAGLAFARKYKGEDSVCMTFLGDGAANAGQFFESMNMAALWKLPVLFIIENNVYGMGTSVDRAAAGELYKRGEPMGIKGQQIEGQDFFSVYEAVKQARQEIAETGMPQLIEVMTYRYRGHSMSDPAKYRTREDVDKVKESRDPIERMTQRLIDDYGCTEDELKAIDKTLKDEIKQVAEEATTAPEPALSEVWTDVVPGNNAAYLKHETGE